jgi:hypothetical protein
MISSATCSMTMRNCRGGGVIGRSLGSRRRRGGWWAGGTAPNTMLPMETATLQSRVRRFDSDPRLQNQQVDLSVIPERWSETTTCSALPPGILA